MIFAQSLRYINKAYEEEILEETIGQHLKGWWRGRHPFFLLLPFKWADVYPVTMSPAPFAYDRASPWKDPRCMMMNGWETRCISRGGRRSPRASLAAGPGLRLRLRLTKSTEFHSSSWNAFLGTYRLTSWRICSCLSPTSNRSCSLDPLQVCPSFDVDAVLLSWTRKHIPTTVPVCRSFSDPRFRSRCDRHR